jgi:hypothetical protein
VKIETNGRDLLLLFAGTQAVAGGLIFATLLISQRTNQMPRISVDSHVTLKPDGEIKVPIRVETAPAQVQVQVQRIETEKAVVSPVTVQNTVQPAEVRIAMPNKPIEVNVVSLPGLGVPALKKPEPEPADPEGKLLPSPKGK